MRKFAVHLATVAIAVLVSTVATTPPAAAASVQTRTWSNAEERALYQYSGYASTWLRVEWKNRRTVDISGWVDDVCGRTGKGDGFAAFVSVYTLSGGALQKIGNERRYRNSLTCVKGRVYFNPRPFRSGSNAALDRLIAFVCSYKYDNGYKYNRKECDYRSFDNPYVR